MLVGEYEGLFLLNECSTRRGKLQVMQKPFFALNLPARGRRRRGSQQGKRG